jgi:CAAX protease family protein
VTSAPPRAHISPPWRLLVFILTSAIGVLGLRLILAVFAGRISYVAGIPFRTYTYVYTLASGLLIGHVWTLRQVEPRGWSYVGLGREALRPSAIALGALFGATAIAVPSLVLLGLGWLRMVPGAEGDSLGAALRSLVVLVPASLWEELLLRGFFFAMLREVWGTGRAIVVTSILFGVLHFRNAGVSAESVVLVTLAGVFLGMMLVATRSLYAAWAAHLAWNFTMAGVLHASVSGIGFAMPNYQLTDAGPDWATGGVWGPEGGVFAGLSLVVAVFVLNRRRVRRGE